MREELFGKEHGLKRHKHIGVVKEVGEISIVIEADREIDRS